MSSSIWPKDDDGDGDEMSTTSSDLLKETSELMKTSNDDDIIILNLSNIIRKNLNEYTKYPKFLNLSNIISALYLVIKKYTLEQDAEVPINTDDRSFKDLVDNIADICSIIGKDSYIQLGLSFREFKKNILILSWELPIAISIILGVAVFVPKEFCQIQAGIYKYSKKLQCVYVPKITEHISADMVKAYLLKGTKTKMGTVYKTNNANNLPKKVGSQPLIVYGLIKK